MTRKRTRTTTQKKPRRQSARATSRRGKPDVPGFTPFECDCGTLESCVRQPSIPIVYDEDVNEYYIVGEDGSHTILRHCFFCGGYAPPSRRGPLVEPVQVEEIMRLLELTKNLKSVAAAIAAFGQPDKEGRTLCYSGLSETATVEVMENYDGTVRFSFSTKRAKSEIERGDAG